MFNVAVNDFGYVFIADIDVCEEVFDDLEDGGDGGCQVCATAHVTRPQDNRILEVTWEDDRMLHELLESHLEDIP